MAKKILLVDDDMDMVRLLAMRLREHRYDVIIAADGISAISKAHQDMPDLIILDMKMPAGNGMTVFENLHKSTRTLTIPIIFLTAYSEKEMRERALNMGAADFITKPYRPDEIISKIRRALGEAEEVK